MQLECPRLEKSDFKIMSFLFLNYKNKTLMKENKRTVNARWLDCITISDEYSIGRSEGPGWSQILLDNVYYAIAKSQH